MKIALFTDTFLPQVNGVVSSIVNYTRRMAERGHEICLIVPKSKKFSFEPHPNITVKSIMSMPALFYQDFKVSTPIHPNLFKFIYENKFQVLHFHTPMSLGLQAVYIGKMLRIPVIGTFHTFFADPQYLKHVRLNFALAEKIGWRYSNIYYNSCDLVTCHSNTTMLELIRNGCSKPIQVISNGIDFSIFDNSQALLMREKYSDGGPLLLYAGRMAHEKNIPSLLQSFQIVLQSIPAARLLMVGDGPQLPEIVEMVKKMEIENNVILTGSIKYSDFVKSGIYGACDLFVTASKTENQPMTILEAMANNVPCIGVDSRGVPELIEHEKTGLIVPPDNPEAFAHAVVSLLQDKKKMQLLKENVAVFIEHHDIEYVLNTWEETYTNLINSTKKRRPSLKHIKALLSSFSD